MKVCLNGGLSRADHPAAPLTPAQLAASAAAAVAAWAGIPPGARPDFAAPRLLHGEGPACWPLMAHAGMLGLPARAGLEDSTTGPGGSPVSGNEELIELA